MRDLVLLGFFLTYVVIAFRQPFAGYLLWGWSGLVALNFYVFGFMQSLPYVQIFALITLIAVIVQRGHGGEKLQLKGNSTSFWMIAFVIHGLICATLAYPDLTRNWELWGNVAKTVLFCLLMPVLATDRFRIHALILMIAIGVSFHGVLDGLKFINSGGSHNAQVISKFGDNNHLAMVLLMVIPLLYYLHIYSKVFWVRWAFLGTILLMVLAVVSTNSRGGLIGMAAVAIWLVYKSRHRLLGSALVAIAAVVVINLAPSDWSERMNTIQSAEEDSSFMGRVMAWRVSTAIAQEHPVFGGGFRAIQSYPVWAKFREAPSFLGFSDLRININYAPAAHSIWFEVLGDQGFLGLFIFMGLIGNSFVVANSVRKLARKNGPEQQWAADLGSLLTVALVAYMVTGSALSAAYFELPYVCMMLLETVRQHQMQVAANRLKGA